MSLRALLISFTVALLTAVASLVWVGLSGLATMNSSAEELGNNWLPSVSVVNAINTATSDFRIYQAEHILSADDASMRNAEKKLADIRAAIVASSQKYEKLISSPEEQGVYDGFKAKWADYLKRSDDVIELVAVVHEDPKWPRSVDNRPMPYVRVCGENLAFDVEIVRVE